MLAPLEVEPVEKETEVDETLVEEVEATDEVAEVPVVEALTAVVEDAAELAAVPPLATLVVLRQLESAGAANECQSSDRVHDLEPLKDG